MDETYLRRLADHGLGDAAPGSLRDAAEWCWDWCEATGDGRYCSLAHTFWALDEWWREYSMVPAALVSSIDTLLTAQLPTILEATDSGVGAQLARRLRHEVTAMLLTPDEWREE